MAAKFAKLTQSRIYKYTFVGVFMYLQFTGIIDVQNFINTTWHKIDTKYIRPSDKFQYQKFRTWGNAGDIRLVDLLPGLGDQKIKLRIRNVALRDSLKYHALSYEWGENRDGQEIILNNSKFTVTPNLYSALQHLRDPVKPLTLWIDAICINQRDIPEKSQQLLKMQDVYELAQSVIIWLGPSPIEIEPVEQLLRNLALIRKAQSGMQTVPTSYTTYLNSVPRYRSSLSREEEAKAAYVYKLWLPSYSNSGSKSDQELVGLQLQEQYRESWKLFKIMIESSYFERAWIIQEVVLGKNRKLRLGRCEVSADDFFDASYLIATNAWFQESLKPSISISSTALNRVAKLYQVTAAHGLGLRLPLGSLLWDFREKKATEPQDHIYSLIGIASYKFKETHPWRARLVYPTRMPKLFQRWPPPIAMDSGKPIYQVYRDAATFILNDEESLSLLGQVSNGVIPQNTTSDWASWVPDWAHIKLIHPLVISFSKPIEEFPKDSQKFKIEGDSLFVHGHYVDTIIASTPFSLEEPRSAIAKRLQIHTSELEDPIATLDRQIIEWRKEPRSFSVTCKGYLVVGPAGAKPGDEIFIVGKSPAPLVLRKSEAEINGTHSYYRLVGDCYYHDLIEKLDLQNLVWDVVDVEIR